MGGDQNLERPKAGTGEWTNGAQGLGMDLDRLLVCSRVRGTHGHKNDCEPSGQGLCPVLTTHRGGTGLGCAGHVYVSTAGVGVGARAGTALCDGPFGHLGPCVAPGRPGWSLDIRTSSVVCEVEDEGDQE